jgi:hypothetical protein
MCREVDLPASKQQYSQAADVNWAVACHLHVICMSFAADHTEVSVKLTAGAVTA